MEQFGRYQLVRRIGSGGMAEVFLARTLVAQGLSKELVIKKIHPAIARSRPFAAMFVGEARVSLGLNHPNVVQVFDFGQIGDSWYLAMEHVEGLDLQHLIAEERQRGVSMPHGLCAYVIQQVAKALDYAHRKTDDAGAPLGIVHRDVSPQNVVLSFDGAVKLTDFGIARARDVHEEEGVVKGKLSYMAPEQARGDPVDRRADVFSAGVILFELATSARLFPGSGAEAFEKIKAGAVPPPRQVNPSVPPALEDIILRALAFDPADRFETARDLQNALGRFQLAWSRDHGVPIDSGALAQHIAAVIDPATRPAVARPPSALPTEVMPRAGDDGERELKRVFVIEGHLRGLAALERRAGVDFARRAVAELAVLARELAYKHGAHVHHAAGADLALVVGLPVTGEDDASRAIRLALALSEVASGIGLDVEPELRLSIGIQRGVALVRRRLGARFGFELSAATTHVARRLATEAAGGDVLCGGPVYREARHAFHLEELTTIALDGDDEGSRARVYRVRGAKARAERARDRAHNQAPIGRQRELAALHDAFRHVSSAQRHRHVVLVGDEGVGKRSLVNAFLAGLPRGEARVIRVAARVASATTPYGVIADLVREVFGLPERPEPRDVELRVARLLALLGGEEEQAVASLRRALGLVLGVPLEGALPIGADRRAVVREAVSLIERGLGQGLLPLVVVVEDLHWADDLSYQVLEDVVDVAEHRGVLAIATGRHDPRLMAAAEKATADILRLEELDREQAEEFLARRFARGERVRELGRGILARTGGNPFFINETLEALIDRGVLAVVREGDEAGKLRWVTREAPPVTPTTIEALLAARVDQLPAGEKEALVHGSVLGPSFTAGSLEALVGRPLRDELRRLGKRRLLDQRGEWLSFRNEMTMAVAYGTVPEEERRALHRRAAEVLAAADDGGAAEAEIARHLEEAGEPGAAARYLAAASYLADAGSSSDALRQLGRGLALLGQDEHERRFAARCLRELLLGRLGRRAAQLREIDGIRAAAEALGDPARLAQAHARLAQFHVDLRRLGPAARAIEPALRFAQQAGDRLIEANALRLSAELHHLQGKDEGALALTERALALTAECDGVADRAWILATRGAALAGIGRLREALDVHLEALVIHRALGQTRLEARAMVQLAGLFERLGEPEDALAYGKTAFRIDQALGDRAAMASALAVVGRVYVGLGDADAAARYLAKARELDGEGAHEAALAIGHADLHRERGELGQAIAELERAAARAAVTGERALEVEALTDLALAELERGDAEAARTAAAAGLERARQASLGNGEMRALAALGLALARLGRAREALEASTVAAERQAASEQRGGAEEIYALHAQVCEAVGQLDHAREVLDDAARTVEAKASHLGAELAASYRASRLAREIAAAAQRLGAG